MGQQWSLVVWLLNLFVTHHSIKRLSEDDHYFPNRFTFSQLPLVAVVDSLIDEFVSSRANPFTY